MVMEITAQQYIQDVVNGKILTCKWVKLAVQRHLADLETAGDRGLYFDEDSAILVILFFTMLKHSKGEWAGQPVILQPWQQFIMWNLFGWKKTDGTRRFKTAYQEVARKNGKSTIHAGLGLYLLLADGEPGAEIYTAATKKDQAKITHSEATRMVKASARLRKEIKIFKDNLHIENTASKYEPLGADEDTLDGLNIHAALMDELHAWKSAGLWDVLETATGARRQPLMSAITTAGFDRQSLCFQLNEYTKKVLSGIVQDDSFFGIIYTLDDDDLETWDDPDLWIKANPNIGISKKMDDMLRLATRAREMPGRLNAFLRLHLNIWTENQARWINIETWQACSAAVDENGLKGRICYAGLDLSSNLDLTAYVLVFPPESPADPFQVIPRFFIPAENIRDRVKNDRVPYDVWLRQGFLNATPGDLVDQAFILAQLFQDAESYDLRQIAFDRWGATQIQIQLQDHGLDVVAFGQGYASMSPPTKQLEVLILSKKIAHGGHPVLAWNMANVMVVEDAAGNIKPDKQKSMEKIDGAVAMIMGLDLAMRNSSGSIYDERGLAAI